MIPFVLYFFGKGRGYYLAPVYPMLFAAGGFLWERWTAALSTLWSRVVYGVTFVALAVGGVFACALILPVGPISPAGFALRNNDDLREEIGWTDLVAAVAQIRDSLSPAERASFGIITGNYGETGALDLYGPSYGLPPVLSGTNTAWYRGYGHSPPQTLIAVGISRHYLESHFESCRLAGHNGNPYGINNEESREHPDIFVCGGPRRGWAEFWKDFQWFG